jgi:3-hydroxyacyl-CoA dehydrogenase
MARTKEIINLADLKKSGKLIMGNDDASLVDIGDGVCCLEIHSPGQVVTEAVIDLIPKALEEAEKNYKGMVIGSQGNCFSAGPNIAPVLKAAQAKDTNFLDNFAKKYQDAFMAIKYSRIPVVAAVFQQTLSNGFTMALHCDRICAVNESFMGFTEATAGLLPWGGGLKEMLIRYTEGLRNDIKMNLLEYNMKVQQAYSHNKVTSSARFFGKDKRQELGFMRKTDKVVDNQDYLLDDAKLAVLAMDLDGYQPPVKQKVRIYGEQGIAMLEMMVYLTEYCGGFMSDYDLKLVDEAGRVICGGPLHMYELVSEQYLLNVEREAFVRLCGEEKTQERMSHLLETGKPLKN